VTIVSGMLQIVSSYEFIVYNNVYNLPKYRIFSLFFRYC